MAVLALVLAVVALLLAGLALFLASAAHTRATQLETRLSAASRARGTSGRALSKKPWVIVNPARVENMGEFKEVIEGCAFDAGWEAPHFVYTEVETSPAVQARQGVEAGAGVVLVAGGDGTVRAVAAGLAHTDVPMAILPAGTGNLMARNMEVPLDSLREAASIGFTGRTHSIDLGWLRTEHHPTPVTGGVKNKRVPTAAAEVPDPEGQVLAPLGQQKWAPGQDEYAFLVMAGVGFDADVMATTKSEMKEKIGWFAYVLSGLRHAAKPTMKVELTLGKHGRAKQVSATTVLFANCGVLTANVVLLPDARPDDGWLDVARLDARMGPLGWLELGWRLLLQGLGIRPKLPSLNADLDARRARQAELRVQEPRYVEVDGDAIGMATHIWVRTDRGAVKIRAL
ncbi:MAG: diacylglycerol kinase family protein [Winkia neuii]|uniref:Diacylglycerol kinase n=1 Tax=Winkia neuii TaxID=33007 RepID=A0A2I1IQM0_9ACTO|nr:diacylglycerol kinase family protein [Winkia neuii]OFJ72031.1 hypothetical protein HMPREF2851_05795 [Actinomyces sp. HMSC064C12]OFK01707.1 hypothetical protein HMPREF2835_08820 [Actinomyces sp. HMSC072A03]OFT54743.1 hypothetical protein HMPREF3152_07715 [Actinomyces sp. HMSC06A08]KWZ74485.1 diacylglycerol kinase catalytic domain protein [Winkia neuii]MDK8100522.1 diacylglycerol kinase family protein [Winkia neuii]